MKDKKCLECGRIFTPRCGTQKYCNGPHQTECKYCGRIFDYTCSPKERPNYCSKDCITEGKKITVKERYGVDNVSKLDDVRKKISIANSSEEVSAKRKDTCIKNWGVDNVAKNESIRAKLSEVMKMDEYLKGREATCIERYGYSSPMMCDSVKSKQRNTCIERYGISGHPHSISDFSKMMTDSSKVNEYLQFRDNPKAYILEHYQDKPTISQLEKDLGVTNTPIYNLLIKYDCRDMIARCYSNMEEDVCNFLIKLLPNIKIERNNRTIIKPQELDIYLPEYNIGIECNPAATHNSSINDPWGSEPKYYKYHQMKSISANEAGIFLFHIFGYEWSNNRSIIESMLMNLLNTNQVSFGGRDTYVCEVSYDECKHFLNMNHRQGHTTSKVRLGLRLKSDDTLVSVMTFSHMRNTMGKSSTSSSDDWELSRFCSKLHTNVIGGASKLFKTFLHKYNPENVISFSDIAHTKGGLYKTLGFQQESITTPSYVWSDIYDNMYYHRVSCQKRYLKKLLNDDSIDIDNSTEKEIMESHGFVRVYDSGVIKWVYNNK